MGLGELLLSGETEHELIGHLRRIETERMGLREPHVERLLGVVAALCCIS